MKQELFKINFEKYSTTGYFDTCPIHNKSKDIKTNSEFVDEDEVSFSPYMAQNKDVFVVKWQSNDQDLFVSNYGNILSSVMKDYLMLVVEKIDNKVSMKVFRGMKMRKVGKQHFRIRRSVHYITVDVEKGDVYYGNLINYNTKRKRNNKIFKNLFAHDPLSMVISLFINNLNSFGSNLSCNKSQIILQASVAFMKAIDEKHLKLDNLNFDAMLFKFYLDKKKIKYPNNFFIFSRSLIGKEIRKCLKKSNNKLVDAYMNHHKLSGKKVKKVLHKTNGLNVSIYKQAIDIFGKDWINQDDEQVSLELFNSKHNFSLSYDMMDELRSYLSNDELRRVYSLFKQVHTSQTIDAWTFYDHIHMFVNLKRYGETNLKWTSEIQGTKFINEHYDWTEKLDFYRRGIYYRIYPQYMFDLIQTQLETDNGVYYPILLDNTNKYNDESQTQSNCVKGYVGRASSIIISLRKDSEVSNVRATIEYQVSKETDKPIKIKRVQTLGRFNEKLSEEWDLVLLKLDEIVLSCIKDKRFEKVKLKKVCANNVEINCDSEWSSTGKLEWSQKMDANDVYYI